MDIICVETCNWTLSMWEKCDWTLFVYDWTLLVCDGTLPVCDWRLSACDWTLSACDWVLSVFSTVSGRLGLHTFKGRVQQLLAAGAEQSVAADQVQCAQQQMVGVHQVIADHGEVPYDRQGDAASWRLSPRTA